MTNDIVTHLLNHRSVRRYKDEPVTDEHIRFAVQAGQAASTSSAVQAYCLIRVRDIEQRRRLVELTGSQAKVAECGAFFVVCGDTRRHRLAVERSGVAYRARLEAFLLAVIDATLFAQNLVLAFESLGYGICYIGGLRNQLSDVDTLLELSEGVYPLYGLCVGVPDEQQQPARPRLPVDAVLLDGAYPTDDDMLRLIDSYDARYLAYLEQRGEPPDTRRTWSSMMAEKFSTPRRTDLGRYYASKGAELT